jgi:hypothetical protein
MFDVVDKVKEDGNCNFTILSLSFRIVLSYLIPNLAFTRGPASTAFVLM